MHSRDAPPLVQFLKYSLCGTAAVGVHLIVFVLLTISVLPAYETSHLPADTREANALWSNLIAWPFGNIVAYLANALWVFTPGRHSRLREFALFSSISFFSFGIGLLAGPLLISEGLPVGLAQTGFLVSSAVVNFVCRKFLIFLR